MLIALSQIPPNLNLHVSRVAATYWNTLGVTEKCQIFFGWISFALINYQIPTLTFEGRSMTLPLNVFLRDNLLSNNECTMNRFSEVNVIVDNATFSHVTSATDAKNKKSRRTNKRVSWPDLQNDSIPSTLTGPWNRRSNRSSESRWVPSHKSSSTTRLPACPPRLPVRRNSFDRGTMED